MSFRIPTSNAFSFSWSSIGHCFCCFFRCPSHREPPPKKVKAPKSEKRVQVTKTQDYDDGRTYYNTLLLFLLYIHTKQKFFLWCKQLVVVCIMRIRLYINGYVYSVYLDAMCHTQSQHQQAHWLTHTHVLRHLNMDPDMLTQNGLNPKSEVFIDFLWI